MILTYRYRVKNLNGKLNSYARAVNTVWNYCNDVQKHAVKWGKKWPSGFDLTNLCAGSSKLLGIHSGTISEVTAQYAISRAAKRRPYLRYRGSKSLGWVPLKGRDMQRAENGFRFLSNDFRVFYSRPLPDGKIKDGTNFSQDAKGNWYLNIVIEVAEKQTRPLNKSVGIDLGLREFASLSTGEEISAPRHYRNLERRLGIAQRARKKHQVTNIHAKIKNRRRDDMHKLSARLTKEFDYIVVGNVSPGNLKKTKMAKSVSDAGWYTFKQMLAYKSVKNGAIYEEVNEAWSTQTCSQCGAISGPKGQQGLNKRTWICSDCGHSHDRDVNAAINILRSGCRAPVLGIAA